MYSAIIFSVELERSRLTRFESKDILKDSFELNLQEEHSSLFFLLLCRDVKTGMS